MKLNEKKIIFCYFGCGLSVGFSGGDMRFFELVRALVLQKGFEITIAITEGGYGNFQLYFKKEPEIIEQIKFIRIKASLFIKKEPFRNFRFYSYFVSMVQMLFLLIFKKKWGSYDFGYATSDNFCDILPLVYMKKKKIIGKMMSFTYHRYPEPSQRPGNYFVNLTLFYLQNYSFKKIIQYSDQIFLLDSLEGEEIGKMFREKMGFRGSINQLKAGIHLDRIRSVPFSSKKYDIIQLGVRPSKGIYDLPDIFERLSKDVQDFTVCLIGKIYKRDQEILEAEFKKRNIKGRVDFAGFLTDDEKFCVMKSARILIAPSHEEGWGIFISEGMACGLVPVSYDLIALKSIYGDSISYAPSFDAGKFAERIADLLKEPNIYNKFRENGEKILEGFDWKKIFEKEMHFFE